MGLQIEEDLQAVLGLAQKAIGVVENVVFLIGEAAGSLQSLHGEQRVPLPQFGQVAAVEKLQKLDAELDVADAAVAGLHFGVALTGAARLLFDPALERLDFVDFGET